MTISEKCNEKTILLKISESNFVGLSK